MGSEEEIGQNSHSPEKCGRDTEVLDAGKAHCLPVSCEPHWDACIVEGAILEDLESSLVRDFVQGLRSIHPRVFGQMDEEDTLRNMRVIAADGKGCLRPTLAGLLALGVYPQKFYPRLVVAFSLFAGNRDEKESLPEKPTYAYRCEDRGCLQKRCPGLRTFGSTRGRSQRPAAQVLCPARSWSACVHHYVWRQP